jgi:hypothetical protein
LAAVGQQLSVISHQLSVIGYQFIGYQFIGGGPSVISLALS